MSYRTLGHGFHGRFSFCHALRVEIDLLWHNNRRRRLNGRSASPTRVVGRRFVDHHRYPANARVHRINAARVAHQFTHKLKNVTKNTASTVVPAWAGSEAGPIRRNRGGRQKRSRA